MSDQRTHLSVYIFDIDLPREVTGVRPCYLIGPFADIDAMYAWVDANDPKLSVFWQSVTLPDETGQLSIYSPERVAQNLPLLHEMPEAKALFERMLAIQTAMERMEDEQDEFVEKHGMPKPPRAN